jgi:hypothetical protein
MRMATGAEGIQRTTTIQITSSRRMLGRRALQETGGEAGNHLHIGNLPYSRKSAETFHHAREPSVARFVLGEQDQVS